MKGEKREKTQNLCSTLKHVLNQFHSCGLLKLFQNFMLHKFLLKHHFSSPHNSDRGADSWRADSSGNEGTAQNTDPEAPNSDPQNTSPPKDAAQASGDKRKTIFRTSSNTPSSATKKKQSLSFSTDPKTAPLDACLSPTNVEPRKSLLEQLSRTFASDETTLPEVVSIVGPSESANLLMQRLMTLLSTNIRAMFQAHNTAEIKAILQSLMTKIQK